MWTDWITLKVRARRRGTVRKRFRTRYARIFTLTLAFLRRARAPDSRVRKVSGKVPGLSRESRAAADLRAVQDGRQGVQAAEGRDRTADRAHQRPFLQAQLVAHPVHLRVSEPRAIGRAVQGLRRGAGHSAQGRHEPGGQGVRRVPDPDAGRADPVAVRGRRGHHARGAAGQPVRAGRDGQRAEPGAENAAGRARAAHDPAAAPRTAAGRQLLDDVVLLVDGRAEGRGRGPAEDHATAAGRLRHVPEQPHCRRGQAEPDTGLRRHADPPHVAPGPGHHVRGDDQSAAAAHPDAGHQHRHHIGQDVGQRQVDGGHREHHVRRQPRHRDPAPGRHELRAPGAQAVRAEDRGAAEAAGGRGVQGRRVGGEQGRDADVPLPRGAGGQARAAGTAGHRDIQERRVRTAPGLLGHRGQAADHVGPGPGLHLHTAHHVRRRLVRARAGHLRGQRGRHAGPAGHRVHVPRGPVAHGADGRGLPALRAGRGAHHVAVGGEGDAQTVADPEPDGEQQPDTEHRSGAQYSLPDEHRPKGRGKGEDDFTSQTVETDDMNVTMMDIITVIIIYAIVNNAPKTLSSRSPRYLFTIHTLRRCIRFFFFLYFFFLFFFFFAHNNYIVSIRIKIIVYSHK